MSVQYGVTCADCGTIAPPVGDGGYVGFPSLVSAPSSSRPGFAEMPTFAHVYEPWKGLRLRPYELEAFGEFLARHDGHDLYLTSDHDAECPPSIERLYSAEGSMRDIAETIREHESEREARREAGEFVDAIFRLDCSCGAYLRPREPELLRAFEPTILTDSEVDLFLARQRAPDDGWNHRILGFWDPYGRFMECLPGFLGRHGSHGVEVSLSRVAEGDVGTHGEIELFDDGADEADRDEDLDELDDADADLEAGAAGSVDLALDAVRVPLAAELYRALIFLVGLSAVTSLGARLAGIAGRLHPAGSWEALRFALDVGVLLLAIRTIVAGYRLAGSLGLRWPWLWAACLCLPLLGLLALLALSGTAARFFRGRGIRVGLFGPSRAAVEAYVSDSLRAVNGLSPVGRSDAASGS